MIAPALYTLAPGRLIERNGVPLFTLRKVPATRDDGASHTAGDEILGATDAYAAATSGTTPPSPFASGGGGSQTLDQVLSEGNDADGFTIEGIVDSANADGVVTRQFVLDNAQTPGIRIERFPIAFDDLGLSPVTYAITAADPDPANTFTVAGDHAADFVAGQHLTVVGSSVNDGPYTIVSAVFGAATVITVVETVTDDTPDGDIIVLPGVVAFTPAAGDLLIASLLNVSVTTAWDGSTPTLWIFQEGAADYTQGIGSNTSGVALDAVDVSLGNTVEGSIVYPLRLSTSGEKPWLFNDTTPLRLGYDDGNGADPGSSVGEGEVVFVVQTA